MAAELLADPRTGRNGRHRLAGLFRQSVFSRLAGYEDVNDADRLCRDPVMRQLIGGRATGSPTPRPSSRSWVGAPSGASSARSRTTASRTRRRTRGSGELSRHGRADHRCEHRRRPVPTDEREEGRHREGRRHAGGLAGEAREVRPEGANTAPMAETATPVFGYKNHFSTDRRHGFICKWTISDAARHDGRELARLLDRRAPRSRPRPPTARAGTRRTWRRAACAPRIISASRRASLCPHPAPRPMPSVPRSDRPSSLCSPIKRGRWHSSSAPSASPGPRSRAAWTISSTTCRLVWGERRPAPA